MLNGPTQERERYVILDALRGLAIMGIALANFPEFGLWTFLSADEQATMPSAEVDGVVRLMQYMLVDGKFYTIFSLLFGVGFSLILARHPLSLFVRRMVLLAMIGTVHLLFIWNGDILLLYAVGGLLLTLFVRCSARTMLCTAVVLILLPIGLDALTEYGGIDFAAPVYDAWWRQAESQGINETNFATWLRDADTYPEMYAFLTQGAIERMWEFVAGHRLPKVLGLFMLGYLAGKHRLYARIADLPVARLLRCLLLPSLLLSVLYAWSATHDHLWGLTLHSVLYAVSVIPLALCYVLLLLRVYGTHWCTRVCSWLSAPGRMALTNYISHSLIGILLFYGIGFGWGTRFGLATIEVIALLVFLLQIPLSHLWLSRFRFGPLEWIWRIFTYGHFFPILKKRQHHETRHRHRSHLGHRT